MDTGRRAVAVIVLLVLTAGLAGQAQTAVPAPVLAPEERAVFLAKAPIVPRSLRDAGVGVTDSRRAMLDDGRIQHAVHIQNVDISRAIYQAGGKTELNFRDSYIFNVAGYRLAVLLGLDNVPMSVERIFEGRHAAFTWWVDDVMMDEKERIKRNQAGPDPTRTSRQVQMMRIWDELIQNSDRNQGNILWTTDWRLWMIDHTRAFRLGKTLVKPEELLRCERGLLDRLRNLSAASVTETLGGTLTKGEIGALLARRDVIVKHFEERIARLGEENVLFTFGT